MKIRICVKVTRLEPRSNDEEALQRTILRNIRVRIVRLEVLRVKLSKGTTRNDGRTYRINSLVIFLPRLFLSGHEG